MIERFTLLREEFPDYPVASLPDVPADWAETSWHNDVSPSFEAPNGCRIFIAYPDKADREFPEMPRFCVLAPDTEEGSGETVIESDDWAAVLAAVDAKGGAK